MDLIEFAKTYTKLEEKSLEIMKVYDLGHYDFDGIHIEKENGRLMFIIKTSFNFRSCGTESEWLTFDLNEIENDIDYFKNKLESDLENKRIAKKLKDEIEIENKKIQKEFKDKAEYERLKLKFEK